MAIITTPSLGSNLITNGTFDTNMTGWTTSGFGYSSLNGGCARSVSSNATMYQTVAVTSGKVYRLEYDVVYTTGGGGSNTAFRVLFGDANTEVIHKVEQTASTPTTYVVDFLYYFNFSAVLWFRTGSSASEWRIDNIKLREWQNAEALVPTDAYNPGAWAQAEDGRNFNGGAANKTSPSLTPEITYGGASSAETTNAWNTRANTWTECHAVSAFAITTPITDDSVGYEVCDAANSFNVVGTLMPYASSANGGFNYTFGLYYYPAGWIALSTTDFGTDFTNYANARLRVRAARSMGADGHVMHIRIACLVGFWENIQNPTTLSTTSTATASLSTLVHHVHIESVTSTAIGTTSPLKVLNQYEQSATTSITTVAGVVFGFTKFVNAVVTSLSSLGKQVRLPRTVVTSTTASLTLINVYLVSPFVVSVTGAASLLTTKYNRVERARLWRALGEYAFGEMPPQAQQYTHEESIVTSATGTTALLRGRTNSVISAVAASCIKQARRTVAASVLVLAYPAGIRIKKTITSILGTVALPRKKHFRAFSNSIIAIISTTRLPQLVKPVVVTTTITRLRDFTLSVKNTAVNVVPTVTPGKIIHQLWTALVALSPVSLVRRIYTEVHSATVGVLGAFTKAKTFVLNLGTTVPVLGMSAWAHARALSTTVVATGIDVGRFVLKVPRVVVTTTASFTKDIGRRLTASVGTTARRFRKFTDNYVATVGSVAAYSYRRLRTFTAVVGLRTVFTRTVIKPVSSFAARVVTMIKRVRNTAVVTEPGPTTITDCGDLLVVEGISMADLNLTIKQGATFDLTLTWNDSAGNPINLTGYTARMQIRQTLDAVNFEHELTTGNGGIVLGGAAGTIRLIISSTDTAAFTWEEAVYDLELISDPGPPEVVRRLLEGCVVVTPEVTR